MASVDDRAIAGPDGAGGGPGRADDAPDGHAVEYLSCAADAGYFIDSCLVIDDAQGHGAGGGTMPFRLWPAQAGIVWSLMTERKTIILKARQLGISWLCCGYALWLCCFKPGQVALFFSMRQDEADELLRRVRVMYDRMPAWLREKCPLGAPPNVSTMEWANGSRIKSLPATRNSGSSWTASFVLMDEAAKIQFADELFTAIKPTIDGGGQLALVSTAKGVGNLFHAIWTRAVAGENGFRPIFLPWWARPGRDREWYAERVREETDPLLTRQEYPASANESFLVSGRPRFDPDWIAAQSQHVWPHGLPTQLLPDSVRDLPGLTVYELPVPGRSYVLAADVAEGLEHGDASDAVVLDAESWAEAATIHVRQEPDEFAASLFALSDFYDAPVAPERNNHGHAVIATLKLLGCTRVVRGHDDRPGWLTNIKTKPQIIDLLAAALRDGLIKVRTQAALDEMQVYQVEDDGKTGAPEGFHDDRVMSRAIALAVIRRPAPNYVLGAAVPVPLDRPPNLPGSRDAPDPRHEWNRQAAESDHAGAAMPTLADLATGRNRRNFYGR